MYVVVIKRYVTFEGLTTRDYIKKDESRKAGQKRYSGDRAINVRAINDL